MSSYRISHRFTSRQARSGTWLFAAGLAVLALAAWDNTSGLPFAMPGFWDSQRTLCLLVAMGVSAFGFFVLRYGATTDERSTSWKPTRPGRRFRSLVIYTRDGCHLCDEAFDVLQSYSACLPAIHEVDIDADPNLRTRFDAEVPVVEFDGTIRFKGRVSEVLLQRLIEGTPPT